MTNLPYTNIDKCRVCKTSIEDMHHVFDMGEMALANSLPLRDKPWQKPDKFPLHLMFCPSCTLVQIKETVDPNVLFKDYLYFSSQSRTMVESARVLAEKLILERKLDQHSFVMEAASNDGYLLQHYTKRDINVMGVDPAENIVEAAHKKGIPTVAAFFTRDFASKNFTGRADVFHANNVLAHVADQNDFVAGINLVLKEDGIAVIEVPYLGKMIEGAYFDQIYHEHLCYFSLSALRELFMRHDLYIVDAEIIPLHTGSIRVTVQKKPVPFSDRVREIFQSEAGMRSPKYYASFAERVNRRGMDLWKLLYKIGADTSQGLTVAAYGAAAKGNQLLNYYGFDHDVIQFVIDSTPAKMGRYMSGMPIPIFEERMLTTYVPDFTIILAWNFAEEIINKNKKYLSQGGSFIIPFPELKVVSLESIWFEELNGKEK